MTDRRIVLDSAAFVDSAHAASLAVAKTADIREITQRFLAACYFDVGKAPRLLEGDEMEVLLRELLPRHFGVKDRLASVTEEVLAAFLAYLNENEVVHTAFDQRQALDRCADDFRDAVASGSAHRDGIAVTNKPKTIVHQASKTGRNDPCPCGSGKKFKKCCLNLG